MFKNIFLITFFASLNLYAQVYFGPFAGSVDESSAVFVVKTYSQQQVKIQMFSSNDVNNSLYSEELTALDTNYNYVKIKMTGLTPNTTYFYRAVVNGIPSKRWNTFITFPEEKEYNFSFGFGSCQQSGYSKWDPSIFPIIAQDTLRFFIQIGDWTYPDTTEKKYGYRFNSSISNIEKSYRSKYDFNYPFVTEVLSTMPVSYVYDDHDFAGNNSDGSDQSKKNSIDAYKMFFPHYKLSNPDNGIWQSFHFGDAEFFMVDLRAQRNPDKEAFDNNGEFNPADTHSILAGSDITGENQKDWLLNGLKKSGAKWKVIISSVIFNPAYTKVITHDSLLQKYNWLKEDVSDKWGGFPADVEAVVSTIKNNDIKNVIILSGDSHSSYIDNGTNSIIPEISASNLDVNNSLLDQKLREANLNIWSEGSYSGPGRTYGKVSFIYGDKDYALLEIIDDKGTVAVSYKLFAE